MKNKSRKEKLLTMLTNSDKPLSCQEMTKRIIKQEKLSSDSNVAKYLSGSISSILAKLVKGKILRYAKGTAVRGGYLYELNTNVEQVHIGYSVVTIDTDKLHDATTLKQNLNTTPTS